MKYLKHVQDVYVTDAYHSLSIEGYRVNPALIERVRSGTWNPGGTFLMIEFKFSSQLEENIGNPFAPMYYGFSLMHCMPVSLAVEGAGLGAVWGEQTARKMLAEAGFPNVKVVDTPR